jgi:hypothetical protein
MGKCMTLDMTTHMASLECAAGYRKYTYADAARAAPDSGARSPGGSRS